MWLRKYNFDYECRLDYSDHQRLALRWGSELPGRRPAAPATAGAAILPELPG